MMVATKVTTQSSLNRSLILRLEAPADAGAGGEEAPADADDAGVGDAPADTGSVTGTAENAAEESCTSASRRSAAVELMLTKPLGPLSATLGAF